MKIKLILVFNHILFLYAAFTESPYWLILTLFSLLAIGKGGGEIYLHKYLSHKSFEMPVWKSRILLVLSIFNCFGSPIEWAGIHRKHHAFSDQEGDPHGYQSKWRVWTTFWKPFTIELIYVKDLMRDPWIRFIHRNYYIIIFMVFMILAIIDWRILAFSICGASALSFHQAGFVNTFGHKNNKPSNSVIASIFSFGSGYHKNHHDKPREIVNGPYDINGHFINLLLRNYNGTSTK